MVDHYISLPLYADPDYNYAVNLQGESYILDFKYNERCGLYFISLYTADNIPLVVGDALVPTFPIMKDYALNTLTGFFWMEEKANIISEPYKLYPDKINEYYNLFYIYSTDD